MSLCKAMLAKSKVQYMLELEPSLLWLPMLHSGVFVCHSSYGLIIKVRLLTDITKYMPG